MSQLADKAQELLDARILVNSTVSDYVKKSKQLNKYIYGY
jgi:hypothetical protein